MQKKEETQRETYKQVDTDMLSWCVLMMVILKGLIPLNENLLQCIIHLKFIEWAYLIDWRSDISSKHLLPSNML